MFIEKLKVIIAAGALLFTVGSAAVVAPSASAQSTSGANQQIQNCVKQGTNLDATNLGAACQGNTTTQDASGTFNNLIRLIINVFSLVVGVVAVIMIIIGGLKYITSAGDSGNVTSAKNTILYAIIGLVIVALAQVIVRFVLDRATTV